LKESRSREAALKEELKRLKEDLKCASNSTVGSVSEIASKEAELLELKEKLVAMKRLKEDDKLALEKEFNEKLDKLEDVVRRADELSEIIQSVINYCFVYHYHFFQIICFHSWEASTLGSIKRRLYNAKCPDILLPSSTKVKLINIETSVPITYLKLCFEGGSC
jgi:hypothetical protein